MAMEMMPGPAGERSNSEKGKKQVLKNRKALEIVGDRWLA
jgi:hypothetical protein